MSRLAILLIGALLAAPALASGDDAGWWASDNPSWWGDPNAVLVLQGTTPGEPVETDDPGASAAADPVVQPEAPADADAGAGTTDGGAAPEPQALASRSRGGDRCARYAKQILKFEADLERAKERKNDLWQQFTQQHIDSLRARQKDECPQADQPSRFLAVLKANLSRAAHLAATAASLGLF